MDVEVQWKWLLSAHFITAAWLCTLPFTHLKRFVCRFHSSHCPFYSAIRNHSSTCLLCQLNSLSLDLLVQRHLCKRFGHPLAKWIVGSSNFSAIFPKCCLWIHCSCCISIWGGQLLVNFCSVAELTLPGPSMDHQWWRLLNNESHQCNELIEGSRPVPWNKESARNCFRMKIDFMSFTTTFCHTFFILSENKFIFCFLFAHSLSKNPLEFINLRK